LRETPGPRGNWATWQENRCPAHDVSRAEPVEARSDKPVFSRHFEKSGQTLMVTNDNAAAENAGDAIVDASLKP